jgi:hypothetical protein
MLPQQRGRPGVGANQRTGAAGVLGWVPVAPHQYDPTVSEMSPLPSLALIVEQVAAERETINTHAESLDAKAGVILGFAGVLVGLGATAQTVVSDKIVFQIGLGVAVLSAALAASAFLPRRYPVLEEVYRLRQRYLTAPEEETQLHLLDTQIAMVSSAAELVKRKGSRVKLSVGSLAISVGFVVAGILTATGGVHHGCRQRSLGEGTCTAGGCAR